MINVKKSIKCNTFLEMDKNIALFKILIDNNQHITIKLPFRFTKRLLIKDLFESIGKYHYIYINMGEVLNFKSLSEAILKDLEKINGGKPSGVTIKAKRNINEVDYVLYILDVLDQVSQKNNINIKFIFDEFQDILNIPDKKIMDKFRSVMQHHENITYIFIGTKDSVMTKIFESYYSPFFHFTKVISLNKLKNKTFKHNSS